MCQVIMKCRNWPTVGLQILYFTCPLHFAYVSCGYLRIAESWCRVLLSLWVSFRTFLIPLKQEGNIFFAASQNNFSWNINFMYKAYMVINIFKISKVHFLLFSVGDDNIKIYLKRVWFSGLNVINLGHDKDKYWALVNKVMNFLARWWLSMSRRILLCRVSQLLNLYSTLLLQYFWNLPSCSYPLPSFWNFIDVVIFTLLHLLLFSLYNATCSKPNGPLSGV